jgi:type II secretory pathway component GspD/PulD (secretin)
VDDGKSAMLASTLSRSESAAVSGIPGLGELPGFQSTTAEKVTNYDSSELVVLITPHIIRRRSSITVGPRIALTQPLQQD